MTHYLKFTYLICFLAISTIVKGQTVSCTVTTLTEPPCTGTTGTYYKVTLGANILQQTAIDWSGYDVGVIIPSGIDLKIKAVTITMTQNSWVQIGGTLTTQGNAASANLVFGTTTVSGSNFGTATSAGGASANGASLPVDMIDFSAERDGEFVNVKWSTASEQNSESFTLLQSKDGINYTQIDRVKAAGFSHSIREYSSVVARPYVGTNHFKLVQTDIDGKFEEFYTHITYGDLKVSTSRPNPFVEDIQLNLVVSNDFSEVELMDIYGNIVYQNTFYTSENVTINTNDVVPGVYFLSIDGNVRRMVKN